MRQAVLEKLDAGLDRVIDWMTLGGIAVFLALDVWIIVEMCRMLRRLT